MDSVEEKILALKISDDCVKSTLVMRIVADNGWQSTQELPLNVYALQRLVAEKQDAEKRLADVIAAVQDAIKRLDEDAEHGTPMGNIMYTISLDLENALASAADADRQGGE